MDRVAQISRPGLSGVAIGFVARARAESQSVAHTEFLRFVSGWNKRSELGDLLRQDETASRSSDGSTECYF